MYDARRCGLLALLLACACATNPAPDDFLPDAKAARTAVHGGWVILRLPGGITATGELLAVSADSIWLGDFAAPRVLAHAQIADGRLYAYDSEAGHVMGLALLGTVSTIGNGMLLILTAPMWLIGGGIASSAQSRVPIYRVPPHEWHDLARFARFPQGMPRGPEQ